jgi:DNA-binding GntR family transcriptional regulator
MIYQRRNGEALIQRNNLEDEIYNVMIDKILNSHYKAGERILLEDLEKDLGVSRTPILGALKKLVFAGLIQTKRSSGFYIPIFSHKDIKEITDTILIFSDAACEIMFSMNDEQLTCIVELLKKRAADCDTALKQYGINAYFDADLIFHETYLECLDNDRINQFYRGLCQQLSLARCLASDKSDKLRFTASPQDHHVMCELILARKKTALKKMRHEHIKHQMTLIFND